MTVLQVAESSDGRRPLDSEGKLQYKWPLYVLSNKQSFALGALRDGAFIKNWAQV